MATVPRVTRQVSTAPLPAALRRAAETPESEGAGVERAKAQQGEAIAGLGSVITRIGADRYERIQQEERDRADRVALLDAENQLSAWENKRLYDPANGALTLKGKDSFGLPEQLAGEYSKVASDIESKLGSERQKLAFANLRASRGQNLDVTIRRHVFGEMQRYQTQELQSLVDNSVNAAVQNANDPHRVGEELGKAVEAIQLNAPHLGLGPEQVTQQVAKVRSSVHVGVIERLLNEDNDRGAKAYFDEARGQIDGAAIGKIEKALEDGSIRGESQRKADEIIAAGGSITEQREKVKGIDDAKLRDAVLERVEHEYSIKERIDRETEEQNAKTAYDIIDRTGNLSKIPASMWSSFSGGQRSAMRSYAMQKAKGVPVETDYATYYGLLQQASNDPAAFSTTNLLDSRAKLGDTEFKQLAELQLSIKSGNRRQADKDLDTFRTNQQVVESTLELHGINPNPKSDDDKRVVAQLYRMLDQRMNSLIELTGKKPRNEDVQQAVDDLLSKTADTKGTFWNLWATRKKRLVEVTYADIPDTDRAQIEQAIKARRGADAVTPEAVLDLYLQVQAKKK